MSSTNTDIESSADAAATSASASGGAGGGAGATMTNSRAATASASSSSPKIDRSAYMQRYAVADAPSTVDVFMFHSRSADKAPGKGKREQLGSGDTYTKLAGMKDWRKCLSNFHLSPFDLDGLQWASVEHYYQAAKFQATAPEFARKFSLTSNSSFCRNPVTAKGAGGKTGKSKGKQIRPLAADTNMKFFSGTHQYDAMYAAMYAKFSQSADLKALLLATGNAVLTHQARGLGQHILTPLHHVRERLRAEMGAS